MQKSIKWMGAAFGAAMMLRHCALKAA